MSKLTQRTLILSGVLALSAVVVFSQRHKNTSSNSSRQLVSEMRLPDDIKLWGKATGPIQLRIDFKEQKDDVVTLVASVRSQAAKLQLEWILPEGVELVSGARQETLSQTEDLRVYEKEISVRVQWPLQKPHLVLRAQQVDGESLGASTVFNLDPSLSDMEKEDIIKAHMQSRKIRKFIK